MRSILVVIVLGVFLISCDDNNKVVESQMLTNRILYIQDSIGWKIEVPETYECIYYSNVPDSLTESIEDGAGFGLSFQKDGQNIFQSTIERSKINDSVSWIKRSQSLKSLFADNYAANGIKVDSSRTTDVFIDGILFNTYEFRIYNDNDSVRLYQLMYSSKINEFDFNISIVTQDLAEQRKIVQYLYISSFEKTLNVIEPKELIRTN
jgi:hypothetical protein